MIFHKKYILLCLTAGCIFLFWEYGLKSYLWQNIFAQEDNTDLYQKPLAIDIQMLPQSITENEVFGEYNIELTFRAKFSLTARAVYVDIYDHSFYFGIKSFGTRMKDVYNSVSPLDISLVTGDTAADGNWQKIKFKHEYRILLYNYLYKDKPIVRHDEIDNMHIIPATHAIRRGFDTIKKGDIIAMKGYLIDWRDTGEFAQYPYQTALSKGQIADFKLGGKVSGLCYYLYVTELITDGFSYQ